MIASIIVLIGTHYDALEDQETYLALNSGRRTLADDIWQLPIQIPERFLTQIQIQIHVMVKSNNRQQGGRTWQTFVGSKNGNENFRQALIYNFRDKCVVFAGNRKFANLTQLNMQCIPCKIALLAQEILCLTQKGTFFAQRSPKSA